MNFFSKKKGLRNVIPEIFSFKIRCGFLGKKWVFYYDEKNKNKNSLFYCPELLYLGPLNFQKKKIKIHLLNFITIKNLYLLKKYT